MELKQSLKQQQRLNLNLQQSLKILQLNNLELYEHIQDQAMSNPLLEIAPPPELNIADLGDLPKLQWLKAMDSYNFNLPLNAKPEISPYEKPESESLFDVLMAQIASFQLSGKERGNLEYIIANLDKNGYLAFSPEQIRKDLNLSKPEYSAAMQILYQMDPCGAGAKNLQECLLLQLHRLEQSTPLLEELIKNQWELFLKNRLDEIAKKLKVELSELKKAQATIKSLNPKPGNGYASEKIIHYVIAEIYVVDSEEGFRVIVNDFEQPQLKINTQYLQLLENGSKDESSYISQKMRQAQWLVKCIQQRTDTVSRCAEMIVQRQKHFFSQGPGNLEPLTLDDLSKGLDIHVSTVSRAIKNKYLQCSWGSFPLASFFSHNVNKKQAGSQDLALAKLKSIIESENKQKPLKDQEIAAELGKEGIVISRRTVVKYRKLLNIATAGERKQY